MKELIYKNRNSIIFFIFVFLIILIVSVANYTVDPDYWARVLQGNAFLELGHILKKDPFSFVPTHIWLDHEWGAGVIFAFIQKYCGLNGIIFLKSVILFFIFVFIYKTIHLKEIFKNRLFDILYFILAVYSLQTLTFSGLRCHFFTFLFFSVFLYILEKTRSTDSYKLLFILPLVMLFWCNIHGGCVSGLGLIFMYAVGELLNKKPFKKYILVLTACCAVLFINPYGVEYVKFILMATTMQRPFVTEWISPFLHPAWDFMFVFKILFVLNFLLILFQIKKIKTDWTKYIVLIVCAYLSFKYVKNTPFFVIASMSLLYSDLQALFDKFINENVINKYNKSHILSILLLAVCLIVFSVSIPNNEFNFYSPQPVKVVEFMKENNLNGKIIAPFDMGSYIAYKMYPDMLIYMDGRYEEVYFNETKDLLDDFYNVQNEGYKILDLQAEYIIVPVDAVLNDYMIKRNDYKIIYEDSENCLYARKDIVKDNYKLLFDESLYIDILIPNFKYKKLLN